MRTVNTTVNETTGDAIVARDETPCEVRIDNNATGAEVFYVDFYPGSQFGIPIAAGQGMPLRLGKGTALYGVGKTGDGSVVAKTTFLTQPPKRP